MKPGIYDTIDEIDISAIEKLKGAELDFSHGLLKAVEKGLWGDLSVKYLSLESGGEILSLIPVYYGTNININALLPAGFQKTYNALVDFIGDSLKTPFLIAGSLISDKGWIPMVSGCDERKVVREMVKYIDSFARSQKVKVAMIKDIHCSFPQALISEIEVQNYKKLYSLPTVVIDTDVDNFAAYTKTLTKNSRKHARKVEKSASDVFQFEVINDYSHLIDEIFPLFRATYLKARYQFDEALPIFFEECSKSISPKTELITCRYKNKIVGALINFYNESEQLNKRIGIDYSCEYTPLIYTSLMYQGIRSAIDKSLKKVYLGQSTYVPKVRLGGSVEDEYFYVKAYDPLLKLSMPWQVKYSQKFRCEEVIRLASEGVSA
ncbi:MAG: hypothetical protein COA42_14330 [Alteromonadaceae bacterium]|nr:MAG: hypothetical protein COA42_14330 [Alteromonadaceae bacterium]